MGVYARADSRFYWVLLERPGLPAIKESTKIPRDAPDAMSRKLQRQRAEQAYHKRMHDLAGTRYELPAEKDTIALTAYATWYGTHILSKRRSGERDRATIKHLIAWFGSTPLAAITKAAVQEYITNRLAQKVPRTERTVTPRTVNREVALLKEMLRDAVPTYLTASPIAGMKHLRALPPKARVLTPAEEQRLLAQLPPIDQAFYIVAVDTLIRLSNVINLKWSEVKRMQLVLEDSKTGPYTVPLSARARAALATVPKAGVYCFPHRRQAKNQRDWRGAVRLMLQRACARCSPPIPYGRAAGGITFHTGTRATGATRMLRAGVDQRTVQAVGNWKDIRSMQGYLHTDQTLMRAAVNRIGRDVITGQLRPKTPKKKLPMKSRPKAS